MKIQGKVWGLTCPIFNKNNVEVHYCRIKEGGYSSKHRHSTKYNRFIVIKGELKVTIWKEYTNEILQDVSIIKEGDETTIPPGDFHKFEALEDTELLEIYWVELKEDDIERIDRGGIYNEA